MPLKIIIVGAGIGGLCAAISLRQAGHTVQIFEKSSFKAETGAALALAPNGVRVLSSFGFSFEKARAHRLDLWETVHGDTLERISGVDFKDAEERFGAPVFAIHRVDLHNELLRLALEGDGGASLILGARVSKVSSDIGTIVLDDGSSRDADLIVAADGLHSIVRSIVLDEQKPVDTGMSAFRFLLPTKLLLQSQELSNLLKWKTDGATIIADTKDTEKERHMVWYSCQSGEVQNFVGIHPSRSTNQCSSDPIVDEKAPMLHEFAHFNPAILEIIKLATDVKCWPLYIHNPLPTWTYGKVILIGDAAHPMLPFGGQGSNQAIEDGGALGCLLKDVDDLSVIPQRLELFEKVRKDRASRIQILSKVRVGKEKDIEQELRQHAGGLKQVPTSFTERINHDYGYDVLGKCAEVLAPSQGSLQRSTTAGRVPENSSLLASTL